jgi:hypothetical protein
MQETPMGSFMLVWFEGDVEKAFSDLAADNSEFGTWFKGQVKELTGVDLGAPPERAATRRAGQLATLIRGGAIREIAVGPWSGRARLRDTC